MGKFEISKQKDNKYHYNLKARNGEIILTSNGYSTKDECKNGIELVRKNAPMDERFDRLVSSNDKPYFNLKTSTDEIIGMSQMYESESSRDNGIESVKKNALDAEIVDLTEEAETVKKKVILPIGSETVKETKSKITSESEGIKHTLNNNLEGLASKARDTEKKIEEVIPPKKTFWRWLIPLLILLALLLFFLLWKSCSNKPKIQEQTQIVEEVMTVQENREMTELLLPNGIKLNAYKGGIEDQMIAFLNSKEFENATEDQLKEKWFRFDNIEFKFNSGTELLEGSKAQIDNIVKILKYYQNAKVKIGAYSDKKGSSEANLKVSSERAHTLKTIFEESGVGSQISGSEGYGDKFATHSADAPDSERALDRIIALRFTK